MTFKDDDSGVETLFSLTDISRNGMDTVSAKFTYYACTSQASDSLIRLASGRLLVRFGEPSSDWLPPTLRRTSEHGPRGRETILCVP